MAVEPSFLGVYKRQRGFHFLVLKLLQLCLQNGIYMHVSEKTFTLPSSVDTVVPLRSLIFFDICMYKESTRSCMIFIFLQCYLEREKGRNRNKFRIRFNRCLKLYLLKKEDRCSIFTHHLTCYTLPAIGMAHSSNSSNVMIHGSTFNSPQGDLHIHNRDSESGMHNFRSAQKSILIDVPVNFKDFVT